MCVVVNFKNNIPHETKCGIVEKAECALFFDTTFVCQISKELSISPSDV
jgi:hypothetical protein